MPKRKPPDPQMPAVNGTKLKPKAAPKTVTLQLRVSEQERDEMRSTAKRLGLSVSEYLRQLHSQAVESLKRKGVR